MIIFIFSGADLIYNVLAAVNNNTLKTSIKIKSFMDENIKEKIRILSTVLDEDENNKKKNISSLRLRDPEWFQGNYNDYYFSITYVQKFCIFASHIYYKQLIYFLYKSCNVNILNDRIYI